jgi:hypothetical protein
VESSGAQVIKNGDPYPSLKNGVLKLVSPTAVGLSSAQVYLSLLGSFYSYYTTWRNIE